MKAHHERYKEYENDATPSRIVVERYRAVITDEDQEASLAVVHYRGGKEELDLGIEYAASADPDDRATGADILGQLGWGEHSFLAESVKRLVSLLDDVDDYVVFRAAVALGHRNDPAAIPALLEKVNHGNPQVRFGVVFGLSQHEDDSAIKALIQLSADEDHDVRNWSVFGLGSQTEADSLEIREALRKALSDPDHEIRGEALVGLAHRGDNTVIPELLYEWREEEVSVLSLEAAEITKDPRLHYRLSQFTQTLRIGDDSHFAGKLADAIEACLPRGMESQNRTPPDGSIED